MARNYSEIQKQIALTGFFSEYLPPCFYLNPRVCFKTIKVTKPGYNQGRQRHENRGLSSHIWWQNDDYF